MTLTHTGGADQKPGHPLTIFPGSLSTLAVAAHCLRPLLSRQLVGQKLERSGSAKAASFMPRQPRWPWSKIGPPKIAHAKNASGPRNHLPTDYVMTGRPRSVSIGVSVDGSHWRSSPIISLSTDSHKVHLSSADICIDGCF